MILIPSKTHIHYFRLIFTGKLLTYSTLRFIASNSRFDDFRNTGNGIETVETILKHLNLIYRLGEHNEQNNR